MNFISKIFGKSPKHSLEDFMALNKELISLSPVTSKNKEKVIENIRAITEEIIWSEQNQGGFFKYLIECSLFKVLWNLLNEARFKEVQLQLIQTATMLIHNLSSLYCKRYLLNTLFYKDIVAFSFDFSDEEVVENYMSMLKAFSINLKPELFSDFASANSFALLSGSVTFMNYHESMIKTASRAVILRIFSSSVKSLKSYIVNSGFFAMFVSTIIEKLAVCDRLILSNSETKLELVLSELSEDLYYINDILELKIKEFTENLGNVLIKNLIYPVAISSISSFSRSSRHLSIPLAGTFLHYLLKIVKSAEIVNATIIGVIVKAIPEPLGRLINEEPSQCMIQESYINMTCNYVGFLGGLSQCSYLIIENSVPDILFSFLTSRDNNLIGTALLLLQSIINCPTVNNSLLLSAGLIPYEKLKTRNLQSNILTSKDFNSNYSQTAIESLLDLLDYEQPLLVFLFKLVCKVLTSLSLKKNSKNCLSADHQAALHKAFIRYLSKLKRSLNDCFDLEEFLFEFEDSWKSFKTPESKEPSLVHLLLPYNDLKRVFLEFREPASQSELLKCEIQRFFLIWSAKLSLCEDRSLFPLDMYPLHYLSNVTVWEQEKSYHMQNKNLVKCSIRLDKNEESFFYASDCNFLLFVKPDAKYEDFYIIKFVESLLNVEAIQDRSDPRRLVFMVNQSELSFETTFEDPHQCLWTAREITGSKRECRESYIRLLHKLFGQLSN